MNKIDRQLREEKAQKGALRNALRYYFNNGLIISETYKRELEIYRLEYGLINQPTRFVTWCRTWIPKNIRKKVKYYYENIDAISFDLIGIFLLGVNINHVLYIISIFKRGFLQ